MISPSALLIDATCSGVSPSSSLHLTPPTRRYHARFSSGCSVRKRVIVGVSLERTATQKGSPTPHAASRPVHSSSAAATGATATSSFFGVSFGVSFTTFSVVTGSTTAACCRSPTLTDTSCE